jgi:hypothetical protein
MLEEKLLQSGLEIEALLAPGPLQSLQK